MFAILRNLHLNEIRSKRSSVQAVDFEDDTDPVCESSMEGPYDFCVDSSKREDIRQAVESLPPPYREIIILREFEELSYEEIARILECPLGTVMSRLARARGKLKLTLRQWDPAVSRTSLRQGGQA
jgi:RNA polymerase sigma-70 factor (ECF subfamily)